MTDSDAELIQRSIVDPERFGELFDRHESSVYRFLARRVGEPEAADLLAETFRVAFETRTRYDHRAVNALPWLYGIGRNLLLANQRRSTRQSRAHQRWAVQDASNATHVDEPAFIDSDGGAERLEIVLECVSAAPRKFSEPLLLFAWEELSYEDVARTLNLPVGTVRSRINRMRRRLHRELDKAARDTRRRSTAFGLGDVSS